MSYTSGPTNSGPHQARTVGGQTYSYDANGNLQSGGGRTYTWTADNLPATVTNGGVTESYVYDADGERVAKTVGGVTTVYFQGLWEQVVGGASKRYYSFNGQVVAMRDSATNAVTYLHGDHLGSVSLATNSSGAVVSRQDFDPWGKARGTSTIAQTSLNYTGQRLDGTGLLYYHARYYDPVLARFVSADSIIPGQSDMAGAANPQSLNRYSYVDNNPLTFNDPTGHAALCALDSCAGALSAGMAVSVYIVIQTYNIQNPVNVNTPVDAPVNPDTEAEPKAPLKAPPGTDVTDTPSKGAARRAADRAAGIGKHGERTPEKQVPLRPGSQSPQGDPGERTEYENPENGAVVHHDPYGNYYPQTDEGIGPHYGVEHPDGSTEHFTYPSKHDPRTNR